MCVNLDKPQIIFWPAAGEMPKEKLAQQSW